MNLVTIKYQAGYLCKKCQKYYSTRKPATECYLSHKEK